MITSVRRMSEPISLREFTGTAGRDWRILGEGACALFRTVSFADGVRLVQAIGELPDVEEHRPAVDLRDDGVTVRLVTATHRHYGLARRDAELAGQISEVARWLGCAADPSALQTVGFTIDALVIPAVLPFWRAVLGFERRPDSPDEALIDPRGRGPGVRFRRMDAARLQGNGIHLDVRVPREQAGARIAAALAAGGRLVSDEHAPSSWVLSDPEGNEARVTTVGG